MSVVIRNAEPDDVGSIIDLMRRFAEFEKLSQYLEVTEERLRTVLFGEGSFVEGLVGLDGDAPVAYALFFPNFASFRGQRGLYLEDIYIDASYRGRGIGRAMLKALAKTARSRGFERIDFQVLAWNEPAVEFYAKLGAVPDDDERHFKFTDQAFEDLAAE